MIPTLQSSLLGLSVGSLSHAIDDTVSASSTQHKRIRALDLMLSRFLRKPANVNSMLPVLGSNVPLTYIVVVTKPFVGLYGHATSVNELSIKLFINSRAHRICPLRP